MLHCICLAIREDSSKDEFCPRDKNKGNSCVCSVGEIPHKFCLNYHCYSCLGGPAVESHSFLCLFPHVFTYALVHNFTGSVLFFNVQYVMWGNQRLMLCVGWGPVDCGASIMMVDWWRRQAIIPDYANSFHWNMRVPSLPHTIFPYSCRSGWF